VDEPLHIEVARALGWTRVEECPASTLDWHGHPPDEHWAKVNDYGNYGLCGCEKPQAVVPRYDTDWSATGPLIERYEITLDHQDDDGTLPDYWRAKRPGFTAETGHPLIAVCYLILALHEAGKLP
jgi:hypothetical protein